MKTHVTAHAAKQINTSCFDFLNRHSERYPRLCSLLAVPIAALDTAVNLTRIPLEIIENLALVAINTIGALFSENYRLEHAAAALGIAFRNTFFFLPLAALSPIYFVWLATISAMHPGKAKPGVELLYQKKTAQRGVAV